MNKRVNHPPASKNAAVRWFKTDNPRTKKNKVQKSSQTKTNTKKTKWRRAFLSQLQPTLPVALYRPQGGMAVSEGSCKQRAI